MKESIFANLSSEELENIKAGQVEVSGTVAELSEGGHGYAWKCCSDNTTPKDTTTVQKPVLQSWYENVLKISFDRFELY